MVRAEGRPIGQCGAGPLLTARAQDPRALFTGITPTHVIILLVIVLIIFGPGRLPEIGHALGKARRGFRDALASTPPPSANAAEQPPSARDPTQTTRGRSRRSVSLDVTSRDWREGAALVGIVAGTGFGQWAERTGSDQPVGACARARGPLHAALGASAGEIRPAAPRGATLCNTAQRAKEWSGRRDSNPRPSPWQGDALPTEPLPLGAAHTGPCLETARLGAESQIRTGDTAIFSRVLYQLSYLGPVGRRAPEGPPATGG